ncbi:MAG: cbb3-type cytochrome oxidase assembly protein CcoS [Chitinophagales bacterium]|nr:cbb3-type cytochrome oxidase assembly protein CcoS [Chitinophagales bacterium]
MSVLFILIGVSLVFALGFLIAFIFSVKNGQFDDDYTPSVRILFEDETNHTSIQKKQQ